jgi:hypothetical protein
LDIRKQVDKLVRKALPSEPMQRLFTFAVTLPFADTLRQAATELYPSGPPFVVEATSDACKKQIKELRAVGGVDKRFQPLQVYILGMDDPAPADSPRIVRLYDGETDVLDLSHSNVLPGLYVQNAPEGAEALVSYIYYLSFAEKSALPEEQTDEATGAVTDEFQGVLSFWRDSTVRTEWLMQLYRKLERDTVVYPNVDYGAEKLLEGECDAFYKRIPKLPPIEHFPMLAEPLDYKKSKKKSQSAWEWMTSFYHRDPRELAQAHFAKVKDVLPAIFESSFLPHNDARIYTLPLDYILESERFPTDITKKSKAANESKFLEKDWLKESLLKESVTLKGDDPAKAFAAMQVFWNRITTVFKAMTEKWFYEQASAAVNDGPIESAAREAKESNARQRYYLVNMMGHTPPASETDTSGQSYPINWGSYGEEENGLQIPPRRPLTAEGFRKMVQTCLLPCLEDYSLKPQVFAIGACQENEREALAAVDFGNCKAKWFYPQNMEKGLVYALSLTPCAFFKGGSNL